jgi:hypothetical protein
MLLLIWRLCVIIKPDILQSLSVSLPLSLSVSVSFSLFLSDRTGVWTQGFMLAKQVPYHLTTPPVHFALVVLEMETHKLFVQDGLELWSSQSQHPKYLVIGFRLYFLGRNITEEMRFSLYITSEGMWCWLDSDVHSDTCFDNFVKFGVCPFSTVRLFFSFCNS